MISEVFIKIYGAVQGVGFRYYTQKIAVGLNLTGWVKNAVDSTVEILAQGKKENLEQLIAWAEHGPDLAQVERIETQWREASKVHRDFEIT